ncbi:bile acid:sodium symporter family protein [Salinisphaera sp. Q1T1-3]|uniref:bile acid:sodium symporter family protein n=1 Tax=Salinisphaera sp. Q1T1-3 TaxID=2321229 RepID=UPI000E73CAEC|nr:bile acid:sodium symporter family protein [Salinisphaera sp. Q1T1-3]RJS94062.1 bile acid:sodium symporter family protein [Salinisphaera sp. Q1T1-3]
MRPPGTARIALAFPLWALALAVLGYLRPDVFAPGKPLIVPFLVLIMFGMGLTLRLYDFSRAVARWPVVGLGLALQYLLMPLAAFLIAHGLGLSRELMLGLVLVGSVAGGTASNVITFLAGGDVALSITITSLSTLVSIIATPLLTWFYVGAQVPVPVLSMLSTIAEIVLLPVAAGMVVNQLIGDRWPERDGWCALASAVAVGLVISIIVALNATSIATLGAIVLLAVVLHNLIGMSAGFILAWFVTRNSVVARTLAIEVGMQNSGLAVALAQQYFGAIAALPGAIFSVWHNLAGAAFAGLCAHYDRRRLSAAGVPRAR